MAVSYMCMEVALPTSYICGHLVSPGDSSHFESITEKTAH